MNDFWNSVDHVTVPVNLNVGLWDADVAKFIAVCPRISVFRSARWAGLVMRSRAWT